MFLYNIRSKWGFSPVSLAFDSKLFTSCTYFSASPLDDGNMVSCDVVHTHDFHCLNSDALYHDPLYILWRLEMHTPKYCLNVACHVWLSSCPTYKLLGTRSNSAQLSDMNSSQNEGYQQQACSKALVALPILPAELMGFL